MRSSLLAGYACVDLQLAVLVVACLVASRCLQYMHARPEDTRQQHCSSAHHQQQASKALSRLSTLGSLYSYLDFCCSCRLACINNEQYSQANLCIAI
jgi:hypothetical protein